VVFESSSNGKYHAIPPVGAGLFHADRQTEGQ